VGTLALFGQLLADQAGCVGMPGQVAVVEEPVERRADPGQPFRVGAQAGQSAGQLVPTLGPVELAGERDDRAAVELQRAMRIAARSKQEQRAA